MTPDGEHAEPVPADIFPKSPDKGPKNYDELIARISEQAPIPSQSYAPDFPPSTPTRTPPPPPTVPAGWYPDPDNATGFRYGGVPSMRYFDGVEWTDHRAPMQRPQQRQASPQQPIIVNQQFAPQAAPVVIYNNGTNHALHLILTVVTCGMWLPVWIIVAIINGVR